MIPTLIRLRQEKGMLSMVEFVVLFIAVVIGLVAMFPWIVTALQNHLYSGGSGFSDGFVFPKN